MKKGKRIKTGIVLCISLILLIPDIGVSVQDTIKVEAVGEAVACFKSSSNSEMNADERKKFEIGIESNNYIDDAPVTMTHQEVYMILQIHWMIMNTELT